MSIRSKQPKLRRGDIGTIALYRKRGYEVLGVYDIKSGSTSTIPRYHLVDLATGQSITKSINSDDLVLSNMIAPHSTTERMEVAETIQKVAGENVGRR